MDYSAALDYMYAHLPMYHRIGNAAYKKDLTNTLQLCAYLGEPQRKFPCIHVAGTNGKGSVSHFLSAIFQAAGYKTGLYVSPHYKDFRERIKINGQYISRREVSRFIERHRPFLEQLQPSFFEMTVGMAFDHFARHRVDIAVIETGLGGRLDSTNVVHPELSVITNISFDHMSMLGNTLAEIAFEKAGIIKKATPVVIGESHPDSKPVFQSAAERLGAALYFADEQFQIAHIRPDQSGFLCDITRMEQPYLDDLRVGTKGSFQHKNTVTVIQVISLLSEKWNISETALRTGLARVTELSRFMGRWQILGLHPTIIGDSAHNEAGIKEAMAQLQQLDAGQMHIVIGFVNDKSLDTIFPLLPEEAIYYFAKANIPRGLEAHVLQEQAARWNLHGKAYASVRQALRAAKRKAKPDDVIFIGGSIFVLGEVL